MFVGRTLAFGASVLVEKAFVPTQQSRFKREQESGRQECVMFIEYNQKEKL
jgi:hypothetical protein